MLLRSGLLLSFSLFLAAAAFAASGDTQTVTLNQAVQIPEAVLQPGQYKLHLEDHLRDRAIVRITEPSGTEHLLLTVPTAKLTDMHKGVNYFAGSGDTQALEAWQCGSCQKPLEFVYPKDEAVKLTAQTGKPIMAYDPTYDKLPDNLSPEDRKVVTLWLLSPQTVTPEGKGQGVNAAKLSEPGKAGEPKQMASANELPKKLPKTATSIYSEIILGAFSLSAALLIFLMRKTNTNS